MRRGCKLVPLTSRLKETQGSGFRRDLEKYACLWRTADCLWNSWVDKIHVSVLLVCSSDCIMKSTLARGDIIEMWRQRNDFVCAKTISDVCPQTFRNQFRLFAVSCVNVAEAMKTVVSVWYGKLQSENISVRHKVSYLSACGCCHYFYIQRCVTYIY